MTAWLCKQKSTDQLIENNSNYSTVRSEIHKYLLLTLEDKANGWGRMLGLEDESNIIRVSEMWWDEEYYRLSRKSELDCVRWRVNRCYYSYLPSLKTLVCVWQCLPAPPIRPKYLDCLLMTLRTSDEPFIKSPSSISRPILPLTNTPIPKTISQPLFNFLTLQPIITELLVHTTYYSSFHIAAYFAAINLLLTLSALSVGHSCLSLSYLLASILIDLLSNQCI